jgi:hypothetical protein
LLRKNDRTPRCEPSAIATIELVPVVGSETAGDGEIRDKATVETLLLS